MSLPENMVHQMIPISISPAPRASSSRSVMALMQHVVGVGMIVGILAGCAGVSRQSPKVPVVSAPAQRAVTATPPSTNVEGVPIQQSRSRWIPVSWEELPGFHHDALIEAWNAWLKSCERSVAIQAVLCDEVRPRSIVSLEERRDWIQERFTPYRVESLKGESVGLLTGYFEPILQATRLPTGTSTVPLYQSPLTLGQRKPWFSRQEIDTLPQAQAELRGRTIAYLSDPIDALVLQIQGSGRLQVTEPDGSTRIIRVAFAGSNEHPYRSVGRWLLDQGLVRDASWSGIKAWLAQNPQRRQELLWSNPRMVFFREESLSEFETAFGPRGAQGVALTPGRSIAVDPGSIPYGTPVWLASSGPQTTLQRLVLAQDTGSAIVGAVRADYFAGWGTEAAELAGRLRQPLQMWVLWPKGAN